MESDTRADRRYHIKGKAGSYEDPTTKATSRDTWPLDELKMHKLRKSPSLDRSFPCTEPCKLASAFSEL